MVGIVIVCHSHKMIEHLIDFLDIFKTSEFEILNGADEKQDFGTTLDYLEKKVRQADKGEGVLIFVDLGSSIDQALNVKEKLKGQVKVDIADCPLLEGCISAVAANGEGVSLRELKEIAEDSNNFRKIKK